MRISDWSSDCALPIFGEVDNVGAATERVDARPGAGVRPFEAPAAGERERLSAPLDEGEDLLGVAGHVVAHPQLGAAVLGLDRQNEPDVADLLALHLLGEGEVAFEAAGGAVGRADITQAR